MASSVKIELIMAPCRRLQFNLSDMYPVPRLGIADLSAWLKCHGFRNVRIRDIIAERIWIPKLLERYRLDGPPEILGIGTTILSLREAFEICRAVKERYPETVTVVGGPGVGFSAAALLRYGDAVDLFIRGEGEAAMLAVARWVSGGGSLEQVPGAVYRDADGARENPPAPFRDLDDEIDTDYEALPMASYRLHPPMGAFPPATMVETARGCTFPCEFCCLSMPVRYKSPAKVERLLKHLIHRYGIREVHFVDPTFTLHRERAAELCARIKPLGLRWSCKTRVDLMPEELVAAMADAGCYLVAFGVESGNDGILASLQKKAAADQAFETFARCRRHRIRTTAYLLVGNPGETDETVAENIRFVRRLQPDYVLYDILQVDPANPLTRTMIDKGLFSWDDLEKYYMTDEPTRLHRITVAGHPVEQAQDWIKQASKDFYVRPAYFWQRIRDLRSLQDAANLGRGGSQFLKDLLGIGRLWKWEGAGPR